MLNTLFGVRMGRKKRKKFVYAVNGGGGIDDVGGFVCIRAHAQGIRASCIGNLVTPISHFLGKDTCHTIPNSQ